MERKEGKGKERRKRRDRIGKEGWKEGRGGGGQLEPTDDEE